MSSHYGRDNEAMQEADFAVALTPTGPVVVKSRWDAKVYTYYDPPLDSDARDAIWQKCLDDHKATIEGLEAGLTTRDDLIARLSRQCAQLHAYGSRLVELLADAWWVEAAHALAMMKKMTTDPIHLGE